MKQGLNVLKLGVCLAMGVMAMPVWALSSQSPLGQLRSDCLQGSCDNGAWAYDTKTADNGRVAEINAYNATQSAYGFPTVNMVFPYGTDVECDGAGGFCTATAQINTYLTPGSTGYLRAAAYSNPKTGVVYRGSVMGRTRVLISPIVDGRTDDVGNTGYLIGFNTLSQTRVTAVANTLAKNVCADPNIDGIQFDIEPFHVTMMGGTTKAPVFNGQYYFYKAIANAFTSSMCKDKTHPEGRFFSVFTFASSINQAASAAMRNDDGVEVGYIVDSLYDLGPNNPGHWNQIKAYRKLVKKEVKSMVSVAKKYQLYYQFAVPAGASVHEFESVDGVSTGISQKAYLRAATRAIEKYAEFDGRYLGRDIWSFQANVPMKWSDMTFTPANAINDGMYDAAALKKPSRLAHWWARVRSWV